MEEAPIRQFHLEFAVPEETFLQNVKLGEETVDDMQQKLDQGADVKDILKKYKVCHNIFYRPSGYFLCDISKFLSSFMLFSQ